MLLFCPAIQLLWQSSGKACMTFGYPQARVLSCNQLQKVSRRMSQPSDMRGKTTADRRAGPAAGFAAAYDRST